MRNVKFHTRRAGMVATLVALIATLTPAIANAHTAQGTITCPTPSSAGTVVFNYQGFPKTPRNVLDVFVTVDTLTVSGSGKHGFDGPSGTVTTPFQVSADGQPHVVAAYTRWDQDGGGRVDLVKTCVLPPGTVVPPASTPPSVPSVPSTPVVPPAVTPPCPTCSCPPTTCVSNRVYVFHIRTTYLGRRVIGVRALQESLPGRVKVRKVTRGTNSRTQYQVSVDYRGLEFPKGQVRSTTVYLKLGARVPGIRGDDEHTTDRAGWFLTQELNRNCMAPNGTLNRDTAQPNPIRVSPGQVP